MGCGYSKILKNNRKKVTCSQHLVIDPSTFVTANPHSFQDIYKLGKIIGSGSFGEVRRATHRQTNEVRAVKIFRKDLAVSSSAIMKLYEEIEILRNLDHPNIVRLYEFFEDYKRIFIVMEFCSGGELFDEILNSKPFSESITATVMYQLLSALAYMHSKNIVHRDLKPENILLVEKGDLNNIKLIDFGTALKITPQSLIKTQIGTAYYIAPEVIKGAYNEKCDIWSAGVLLFILLAGYPPFDGQSDEIIFKKINKLKPNFSNSIWKSKSDEANDLVLKMLKPEQSRISAAEALNHEWFQKREKEENFDSPEVEAAISSLKQFHRSTKLREAVSTFITTQCLSFAETKEMRKVFKNMDINGDGKLSKDELFRYFSRDMGEEAATDEVVKVFSEVDTDNNGFVDYSEFISAALDGKLMSNKDYLKRAFDYFDSEGKGVISAIELKKILTGGNICEDEVWTQIIKEVDKNKDGVIDFLEFEGILKTRI